jgi:hypothetical protein
MNKTLTLLFYLLAAAFCIRVALAMAGVTGPVNEELHYIPVPGYLEPVLLHAGYGVLLFVAFIVTGYASLHLTARALDLNSDDLNIFALPAGLIVGLALSLLSLTGTVGQFAAGAILIAMVLGFWRARGSIPVLPAYTAAFITLLAVAFGSHLAFMWRPATAEYAGAINIGDIITYMGWYYTLEQSPFPFFNFAVEGDLYSYFNNLQSIYALVFNFLPQFDIYLFITASLGTFFILSVAWMVHALYAYRLAKGYPVFSLGSALITCVLFVACVRNPSWIAASPPLVFMIPMVLAVIYSVARAKDSPARLAFAFLFAVLGSAMSKVVSVAVTGAYTGLEYLKRIMRRPKPAHLFFLLLVASATAIYIAYMILKFSDLFLPKLDFGPESWHRFQKKGWAEFHKILPTLLKDLGLLLVLYGVFKLRDRTLFFASAIGLCCHFAFPGLMTSTPTAILVLLAGYIVLTREIPKAARSFIVIGVLLILPHHFKRDPGQHYMTLIWMLTLAPAVLLVLRTNLSNVSTKALRRNIGPALILLTSTLTVGLSLVAVANADLRLGKKKHRTVSTAQYDIWLKAKHLTPESALLFTDQFGEEKGPHCAWNDYALMAQRQFYLVSWTVSNLRNNADERRTRTANNAAVLSGTISPASLQFSRVYNSYYAVVEADQPVPATFKRVYDNTEYSLYEIVTAP